MTRVISIYAAQIVLGGIAMAAGIAKLAGVDVMVTPFQALGLGPSFLAVAGLTETIAGFCLLLPRGGIVGALLLACVMVASFGGTLGHVASLVARGDASVAATNYRAGPSAGPARAVSPRGEWDI